MRYRSPILCNSLRNAVSGAVFRGGVACISLRTCGEDAAGALERIDLAGDVISYILWWFVVNVIFYLRFTTSNPHSLMANSYINVGTAH